MLRRNIAKGSALTWALLLASIFLGIALWRQGPKSDLPDVAGKQTARLPAAPPPDLAADDEVLQQRIPHAALDQCWSLEAALRAIASASHRRIEIDWQAIEAEHINRDSHVSLDWISSNASDATVALGNALRWIFETPDYAAIKFRVEDGVIFVGTREEIESHNTTLVYNVHDVIDAMVATSPSPREHAVDALVECIRATIAHDTWTDNGGTVGHANEFGELLFISQTNATHRQIIRFLDTLAHRNGALREIFPGRLSALRGSLTRPSDHSAASVLSKPIGNFRIDSLATIDQAVITIAKAASIPIHCDWKTLGLLGIERSAQIAESPRPSDRNVGDVLRRVLVGSGNPNSLDFAVEDQVLVVAVHPVLRAYSIHDLVARQISAQATPKAALTADPAQDLINVITNAVEPSSWKDKGGKLGSIQQFGGNLLVVRHTAPAQDQIAELLEGLRAATNGRAVLPGNEGMIEACGLETIRDDDYAVSQ